MNIAFVGGTRFIGHFAVEAALARGHAVSVLHRGQTPTDHPAVTDIWVDRGDRDALRRALERARPDVVVDTRSMLRSDAEGVVAAVTALAVPVVVLSSQDVYAQFGRLNGLPAPEPEVEVDERSPLTIPFPFRGIGGHEAGPDYDKKEVEAVFRASGLTVRVLRLPGVYGPRDPRRRFWAFVDRLDAGERAFPRQGGGTFRWTHAHVRDVAHAIVLAAESSREGFAVYNVGEAPTPTQSQRVEALAACMGVELTWIESPSALPDDLASLGVMPNDLVVSSRALREELGFTEVTTPEACWLDVVRSARNRPHSED